MFFRSLLPFRPKISNHVPPRSAAAASVAVTGAVLLLLRLLQRCCWSCRFSTRSSSAVVASEASGAVVSVSIKFIPLSDLSALGSLGFWVSAAFYVNNNFNKRLSRSV